MRRSHGSPPLDDFRQLLTSRLARVIVKTMDMRLRKFLAVLLVVAVLFTLPLFTGATGVRAASDEIKIEVDTSGGGAVARWSPVEGASYYTLSAGGSSLEVRDLTADITRLLPGGGSPPTSRAFSPAEGTTPSRSRRTPARRAARNSISSSPCPPRQTSLTRTASSPGTAAPLPTTPSLPSP